MARLVEELLLLARSDEGRLVPAGDPSDVLAVARAVVATGDYQASLPGVTVTGTPAWVEVPTGYLERIIANLVDNARRFAASQVEVVVRPSGETATLEVRDDGPGVPADERADIFERFVRLDEARDRDHGGFGLGLAIVAGLCHGYGGTIEVGDADPGRSSPSGSPPRKKLPSRSRGPHPRPHPTGSSPPAAREPGPVTNGPVVCSFDLVVS